LHDPDLLRRWGCPSFTLDSFDEDGGLYEKRLVVALRDVPTWLGKVIADEKLGLRKDARSSYLRFIEIAPPELGIVIRYAHARLNGLNKLFTRNERLNSIKSS
jgi:hypothetical protein